jgi:hypothetical protein
LRSRVWHVAGATLAIAAGAYFLVHATRSLEGHDLRRLLEPRVLGASAFLTLTYATLVPITALAWTWLLRGFGQPVRAGVALPVLAATQFGKYLPGNVAQHFGRVLVARSFGMQTAPLVLSMSYETVLVTAACAHASALSLLWSPPPGLEAWPVFRHQVPAIALLTLAALLALALLPPAARWILLRRASVAVPVDVKPRWATSLACYATYLLNFALVGAGLWVAAHAIMPTGIALPAVTFFIGAFASSWILGFLAPGAPAGLGVREAALALWFEPAIGATAGVLLIVLLRIATTLGDLGNFAWGSVRLARLRTQT